MRQPCHAVAVTTGYLGEQQGNGPVRALQLKPQESSVTCLGSLGILYEEP